MENINNKKDEIGLLKRCLSFPAKTVSYVLGSNIAGIMVGAYEGFGDVWVESVVKSEKRWERIRNS